MLREFLGKTELFGPLEADALARILRIGVIRRHVAGADILCEGSSGEFLHLIHRGRVRISKLVPGVGEEALALLEPGDSFGEIEFFDSDASAAHVVAHTDCELLSIPHSELRELITSDQKLGRTLLWAFGRAMSRRIRDANDRLAARVSIPKAF